MTADDGRPIGVPRMSLDYDEWLACHNKPEDIQRAIRNCQHWIEACETRNNPRCIDHWQHRLTLLRAKALLMGIQPEE